MIQDYDSSKAAWDYYCCIYRDKKVFRDFDMECPMLSWEKRGWRPNPSDGRYLGYLRENSELRETYGRFFALAGDCLFNFNPKKTAAFAPFADTEELKSRLRYCASKHHSLENLALMPATGGLNCLKGLLYLRDGGIQCAGQGQFEKTAYDRPDTLICCLNEYFEHGDELALCVSTAMNRDCLRAFLDSFSDVYHYCETMYLMDAKMTERMLRSGTISIDSPERLRAYLVLACDYWETKRQTAAA